MRFIDVIQVEVIHFAQKTDLDGNFPQSDN